MAQTQAERAKRYRDGKRDESVTRVTKPAGVTEGIPGYDHSITSMALALAERGDILSLSAPKADLPIEARQARARAQAKGMSAQACKALLIAWRHGAGSAYQARLGGLAV